MTSPRKKLAAALRTGLKTAGREWRVIDYPTDDPGNVAKPTLLTYQAKLKQRSPGVWDVELPVWVLTSGATSRAEDGLEVALWDVLDVLTALPWVGFEEVERGSFRETWPGYLIPCKAILTLDKE